MMNDSHPQGNADENLQRHGIQQHDTQQHSVKQHGIQHHLDTQGLICPEPVMLLHRAVRNAEGGEYIEMLATDPATTRDIPNFCHHLGHTLVESTESNNPEGDVHNHTDTLYRYVICKKLG